jgi:phosphoribosyl 1,2-cyclic phosphate phosphodiesterase
MGTEISKLRVQVLGCGTSTGVPLIQCQCAVCQSADPKNKRLRASILVEADGKNILIDAGPDFREQALRAKIPRLDAVLITHPHYDHIGGIEELRSYNFIQRETISVYAHHWSVRELKSRLPYLFDSHTKIEGGGIANINLIEFDIEGPEMQIAGVPVTPIAIDHGTEKVCGYRFDDFAYLTDCHRIPDAAFPRLKNLEVLVLDCLRLSKHDTHLSFDRAVEYARQINARRTIFTHMSHDFDYESFSKTLPKNFALAYDGMIIEIKDLQRT